MFTLKSAALTHATHRSPNSDNPIANAPAVFFEPDTAQEWHASGCLYLLADSAAGPAGQRAGQFAARKVQYEYYKNALLPPAERLRHAIRQASGELAEYTARQFSPLYAAASLTAAVVRRGLLTIAQAGSGQVWLMRGGETRCIAPARLSSDDDLRRPDVLGSGLDVEVGLVADVPLMEGDRILICTDNLARLALPEDWRRLTESASPEEIARQCVDFAVRSGVDAVSVLAVVVGPPPSPSQPVKLAAKGHAPRPVTPQEVLGMKVEAENQAPAGLKFGPIPPKFLPWLIGAGVLLAVAWIGVVVVGLMLAAPPGEAAFSEETGTPTAWLLLGTESALGDAASCPATCMPLPTSSPTFALPTLASTAILAPTLAITPTLAAPPDQCQYTIRSGDFMAYLVQQLQVTYSDARCAPNQPLPCAYDPANAGNINIGWVLIFSNTTPEVCAALGGSSPQPFPTRTPAPITPAPAPTQATP